MEEKDIIKQVDTDPQTPNLGGIFWQQDDALLLLAIHHDLQRTLEAHMPHILRFLNSRHRIE